MKNLIFLLCMVFAMHNGAAQDEWTPGVIIIPTDSINQILRANDPAKPIYYRLNADEHYHAHIDGSHAEVTDGVSIDWIIGSAELFGTDYQLHMFQDGPDFYMGADELIIAPVASFEEDDGEIVSDFFSSSAGLSVALLNHKYETVYYYRFDLGLALTFEGLAEFDDEYIDIALMDQNNAVLVSNEGEVLHVHYDGGGLVLYEYALDIDDIIGVERNPSDGQPVLISSNASTDFIYLDLGLGTCEIDYIINAPGTIPDNCRYDWKDYDCDGDGDLVFHMNSGHTILLESKIAQLEPAFVADLIYVSVPSVDAPISFIEYNDIGRNKVALAAETGVMTILTSSNPWCSQAIPTIRSRTSVDSTHVVEIIDISIYPNPIFNQFQIKGLQDNPTIHILDISGSVVKTYSKNERVFDISEFTPGTYFICIQSQDEVITKKIIKT